MKRIFSLLGMLSVALWMNAAVVNYTADNSSIFPNPERGYYVEFDHVVTEADPWCVMTRAEELRQYYVEPDNLSLVLVLYYLDNFRYTDVLPDEVFEGFEDDMQTLRNMGLKAILRFAYTASDADDTGHDAPLARVEKHIAQYKPFWEANEDVIYCFQAGFVGAWGEWYYTENFGNKVSQMNESRRALVDTLLKAVPEDRYIQLRTPLFKTGYIGDTDPLTKEEAYSGSPRARLGHHNDAFLYGPDNMGTYVDTATQKPYLAKETLYVPMGGETDITDEDKVEKWASREKTIAEMSRLHWTFIQGYYSQTVTNEWRKPANGTFDELNRRLGYRYQLVQSTIDDEVEQGDPLSVKLQIRNAGFAPLYNERHAFIVLKGVQNTEYRIQMKSDPRTWLPNGVVTEIDEQIAIPSSVPTGTYHLYLHMPDAYATLATDSRYAVRFANTGVWDEETGYNDLNAEVTISEKVIPFDPETPIALPATLDKGNVYAYSDKITWYEGEYFNFGDEDKENLDTWVEWKVELKYPGKYKVSEIMRSVLMDVETNPWLLGHTWAISLLKNDSPVSTYITKQVWEEGELSYDKKWDLSDVAKGVYILHIQNSQGYLRPKLKSLTLEYDGEIPTDVEEITGDGLQVTGPQKVLEDGIFYILMPNGRKYYCF